MAYYRCPACAFAVRSGAARFTPRTCPRCSIPLTAADQLSRPARPPIWLKCRFAAEPRAAAAARRALDKLLWELEPAACGVVALLTTELIANGVEHGCGRGEVHLEATLTADVVRIAVRDDGPGFVPTPRGPDAPLESHWGLHMVEEMADRWGVAAEPHTMVWFELDRVPSGKRLQTAV
jgi:anti-sigma regulatory factor (Ser/Thr protein kinase)